MKAYIIKDTGVVFVDKSLIVMLKTINENSMSLALIEKGTSYNTIITSKIPLLSWITYSKSFKNISQAPKSIQRLVLS